MVIVGDELADLTISYAVLDVYRILGHWYCKDVYYKLLVEEEKVFIETGIIGPIMDEIILVCGFYGHRSDKEVIAYCYESAKCQAESQIPKTISRKYKSYKIQRVLGGTLLALSAVLATIEVFF